MVSLVATLLAESSWSASRRQLCTDHKSEHDYASAQCDFRLGTPAARNISTNEKCQLHRDRAYRPPLEKKRWRTRQKRCFVTAVTVNSSKILTPNFTCHLRFALYVQFLAACYLTLSSFSHLAQLSDHTRRMSIQDPKFLPSPLSNHPPCFCRLCRCFVQVGRP